MINNNIKFTEKKDAKYTRVMGKNAG